MSWIKNCLLTIRMRLLTLLAGKSVVAINCNIIGTLVVDKKNSVVVNCRIIGNTENIGIKVKEIK